MYIPILLSIVAIILSYLIITYLVPYAFPNIKKYSLYANKLAVDKVAVPLTIGSCDFDNSTIELNTSNPDKKGFIFMPNSNNLKGGSQFSYSFWLDIKSSSKVDLRDTNIFMRGNPSLTKGVVVPYETALDTLDVLIDNPSFSHEKNMYPLVACPLVRFPDRLSDTDNTLLEIVFNTKKNPFNKITVDGNVYNKIASTNSNPKWFLITVVFQDYIDFSNSEKGIQIQNFINDNLVSTKIIKNDALKLNNGNFHIMPNNASDIDRGSSLFSDIVYYNYALDIIEIQNIYNMGVSNTSGGCVTAKYSDKEQDIYNTLGMNNYLQN